jgi:YesN/AraC family two-component response regulator
MDDLASSQRVMHLTISLKGTFMRIISLISSEMLPESMMKSGFHLRYESMEELRHGVSMMFKNICLMVSEAKLSSQKQLFIDIKTYIDAHYCFADLSLSYIANKFNISEAYLSRAFRETNGKHFSSYIETIRLKKALELIHHSALPVKDIAQAVGYLNVNSFYKAFKRVYGVAPGSYRERG